ncbi:MAG: acylphosphatase [Candidatus Bathyarchaeota archaeon]|nr:acylphosphatase [Candidatus Bathyarchaeota archaeon]
MKARVHLFVTGKVQGVFFRSETRRRAMKLNVTGWVRNLKDGRVEALLEGNEEGVDALIDFCRCGPSGAIVMNTEIIFEKYTGEFKNFRIVW